MHPMLRTASARAITPAITRNHGKPANSLHLRASETIGALNTTTIRLLTTINTPCSIVRHLLRDSTFQLYVAYTDLLLADNDDVTTNATIRDSRLSRGYPPNLGFHVANQYGIDRDSYHRAHNQTYIKLVDRTGANIPLPVDFGADVDIELYPNA